MENSTMKVRYGPPLSLIPYACPKPHQIVANTPTFYGNKLLGKQVHFLKGDPRCNSIEVVIKPGSLTFGDQLLFQCPEEVSIVDWGNSNIDLWSARRPWTRQPYIRGRVGISFLLISHHNLAYDKTGRKLRTYVEVENPMVMVVVEPRRNPFPVYGLTEFYNEQRILKLAIDPQFTVRIYYNDFLVNVSITVEMLEARALITRSAPHVIRTL